MTTGIYVLLALTLACIAKNGYEKGRRGNQLRHLIVSTLLILGIAYLIYLGAVKFGLLTPFSC